MCKYFFCFCRIFKKVLEEFLNNSKCSDKIAEEALDHLDAAIYDTRSSDYKKYMFRISIKDAINELVNKHTRYDDSNNQQ